MGDMAGLPLRRAGRVILLDPGDRVLLLRTTTIRRPGLAPPGSPRWIRGTLAAARQGSTSTAHTPSPRERTLV
jgi:hypothetical protein